MTEGLTPKQSQAVSALMCHSTVKAAAASVGVSDRTLRTWLDLPEFQAELRQAQREALDSTMRVLSGAMVEAATLLRECVRGKVRGKNARLRLAAAKGTLSAWPVLAQAEDFERRISELEARLDEP